MSDGENTRHGSLDIITIVWQVVGAPGKNKVSQGGVVGIVKAEGIKKITEKLWH